MKKTPMKRIAIRNPTTLSVKLRSNPEPKSEFKKGKPRLKMCANKECRKQFQKERIDQKVCGWECGVIVGRENQAKQERKVDKMRKEKLKTRSDYMKDAQMAINKWVREVRDAGKPCISCGKFHQGQNHCGHYLSRGSHPNLALEENNLALQCMPCNVHLSGNQLKFRVGLIERIGLVALEALEADKDPRKYSTDDLKAIKHEYLKRIKDANL